MKNLNDQFTMLLETEWTLITNNVSLQKANLFGNDDLVGGFYMTWGRTLIKGFPFGMIRFIFTS